MDDEKPKLKLFEDAAREAKDKLIEHLNGTTYRGFNKKVSDTDMEIALDNDIRVTVSCWPGGEYHLKSVDMPGLKYGLDDVSSLLFALSRIEVPPEKK